MIWPKMLAVNKSITCDREVWCKEGVCAEEKRVDEVLQSGAMCVCGGGLEGG